MTLGSFPPIVKPKLSVGAPERIRTSDPQIRRLNWGIDNTHQSGKPAVIRTITDQGLIGRFTNEERRSCPSKTKNAVAGVKARNGAKQKVSGKSLGAKDTAQRPALASRLVALIDRDGTVAGLFQRPDELRAFLQGGCL
ncbi:MAG: hypothetical protein Q7T93_04260 [Methylobacterium sp.]|uniref:hypothetical protein n=1 Tax=Methylobacterium sp. TaxID=409 RepID=UPI0027223714|nr:hypothetical protein [Methylobacterium sp.]MDO9426023.1 hypothetical protein [Methylobacterium sp.]